MAQAPDPITPTFLFDLETTPDEAVSSFPGGLLELEERAALVQGLFTQQLLIADGTADGTRMVVDGGLLPDKFNIPGFFEDCQLEASELPNRRAIGCCTGGVGTMAKVSSLA